MKIDYSRMTRIIQVEIEAPLRQILDAYDAAGLPWERCLTRLSLARWLNEEKRREEALEVALAAEKLANQYGFVILLRDVLSLKAEIALTLEQPALSFAAQNEAQRIANAIGCQGPVRP